MPEQTFKIVGSPEHNPLKAKEIKQLLWHRFSKSEWEVREIDQVDWQCGHSEKDAIQVMCPICEIAELRNRIEDKDADLAKQKAEITRLKQWCAYRNDRIVIMEKEIKHLRELCLNASEIIETVRAFKKLELEAAWLDKLAIAGKEGGEL